MKLKLHWQIAIALGLAVIVGALVSPDSYTIQACAFVGGLFLNALKMVVVPLIASSIIYALLTIPDAATLSRIGGKAMIYYIGTCLLAVLTGLLFVNLIEPGVIDGVPAKTLLGLSSGADKVSAQIAGASASDITQVFYRMIPANPLKSAVDSDLIGVVFFCLLFGFFATRLPETALETQRSFWGGVREAMMGVTGLVMKFAPIGVFALVAKAFSNTGVEAFEPLAWFLLAALGGLAFHMFVTMSFVLALVSRVSPWRMLKAMSPALLTAFSTSTSAGTLPVTLDCLRRRVGVSDRVISFTLPLGATINLDGTALYECAVAIFLAQAYGLHLGFATQFLVVLMAVVTSMGVAGIPSASMVAISVILTSVGLPLEGIGVILAVDRVLDMCRTAVNVYGDACGAVVVARLEGETGILQREAVTAS